jgi:hypothetical protein
MKVDDLRRHNYSQAVRDALGNHKGPYKLSVEYGPTDEAILTLNLPATQQGYFRMNETAIKIADEYVPVKLQFTYVPISIL